jgi:hypothetical protein
MAIAAGILAVVFACLHGLSTPAAAPPATETQEGAKGAPPRWARLAWRAAGLTAFAGGVYLIANQTKAAAALATVGLVAQALLAIANGYWIHGTPTVSHHLVRAAVVMGILGLAFVGAR